MKKTLLAALTLTSALATAPALANDGLAAVFIGGGVGGLLGHAVAGRNGAIVGGLVGAAAGAAMADERQPRRVAVSYNQPPAYYPRPAPVYYAPSAYAQPVMVTPVYYRPVPPAYDGWGHHHREHFERYDRYERY